MARAVSSSVPYAGGTQYAVLADPANEIALPSDLVAVGLPVEPTRPPLTELVHFHPPATAVTRAITTRESCRHLAHAPGHAPVGLVVNRQFKARYAEVDGFTNNRLAE